MQHYHFNIVSSTNEVIVPFLEENNLIAVTADYQTKGRGRNENKWEGSVGKNIYCSIGIRHFENVDPDKLSIFQAIGCLAVIQALKNKIPEQRFVIKYPNDIYAKTGEAEYKKISGILIENSFVGNTCNHSIIGIGLNVAQTEFSEEVAKTATSLKLLGYNIECKILIEEIIKQFMLLLGNDFDAIFENWKNELNIIGKQVQLKGQTDNFIIKSILSDCRLEAENLVDGSIYFIDNGDSVRYKFE